MIILSEYISDIGTRWSRVKCSVSSDYDEPTTLQKLGKIGKLYAVQSPKLSYCVPPFTMRRIGVINDGELIIISYPYPFYKETWETGKYRFYGEKLPHSYLSIVL